jgi:hypothetical protein
VRYIFQVIKASFGIRYLKGIAQMAVADKTIGGRIEDNSAVNYHPIIVITQILGFTGVSPDTIGTLYHIIGNVGYGNLYLQSIRGSELEGNPRIGFNTGKLGSVKVVG